MASFAVTNLINMAYGAEVTAGTVPSISFQQMRVKGQSLNPNQTYIKSGEFRADRQIPDQILVDQSPGGALDLEVSYGACDDFWAATLQNALTWSGPANFTTGASVTSTSVYTVASGGTAAVVNSLVYAKGWTTAGNNGVNVVTASTGTTITVTGTPLTIESGGAGKTLEVIGIQGASGDITATSGGLASATLDFTTLGLAVGQWIKVGGALVANQFAINAANNGFARITAIAAHALTCDNLPTGWGVDAGTGKLIRIQFCDYIRNGTTQTSFTLERAHTDVTNGFFDFSGMYPNTASIAFKIGALLDSNINFMGLSTTRNAATLSTGAYTAAPTNSVFNAASNVVRVYEGGAASGKIQDFTANLNNNLRAQKAVGTLGNAGIGVGQFEATMQFNVYLVTGTGTVIYDKFTNSTQSSFSTAIQDTAGNAYLFTFPAVKYTACSINAGSVNQDCILGLTAAAKIDTLTNCMFQIDRLAVYGA